MFVYSMYSASFVTWPIIEIPNTLASLRSLVHRPCLSFASSLAPTTDCVINS